MGMHGQTRTTMLSYSVTNGKPIEDLAHGKQWVTVYIEGVSTQTDFEVIDIVDDSNSYPALLRINWAIDMNEVINLKKCKMIFEKKSLRVVVPLDPAKGERYTELACDDDSDDDLDCI